MKILRGREGGGSERIVGPGGGCSENVYFVMLLENQHDIDRMVFNSTILNNLCNSAISCGLQIIL